MLKKPGGEGKRALVLPKQQYDKRKTSLPNMSWPTPEMYRRNGLGLLSLPEARWALTPDFRPSKPITTNWPELKSLLRFYLSLV